MQRIVLPTGLTVIYDHKPVQSVTLFAQVRVGSNSEPRNLSGISHYLEHMIFEGTKKRKNSVLIANEIERWGGEFNAFTQNDRTCFYIKVLRDYFPIALDIMADIIEHSVFPAKFVEKERKVIIKEIDMVTDDPRLYQWIISNQVTFPGHVAGVPIHGSKQSILSLSRRHIVRFYRQYYTPSNMVFTVVGDIAHAQGRVKKAFSHFSRKGCTPQPIPPISPLPHTIEKIHRRKINSAYCVWSWHAFPRLDQASYAFEIVNAILSRGQSGTLVDALRNRHALAYEVATAYENYREYGYFSVSAAVPKTKLAVAKKAVLHEIRKLAAVTGRQIEEAKNYLIGKYLVENEDTLERADQVSFFEQCGNAKLADEYVHHIRALTKRDVGKAVAQIFGAHHSLAIVMR